ncbi:uncharacterized protein BDR25DRAFT_355593 [Lindgomyces ingoldianus]|uniref:Uncharacterized protein n=1 Tax=Lindgomyces ingoldianus TaxID=673940 RepID=A0ACB6QWP2_9PLEO|nr:uncharacterized protein BDR25DRAFT_355593 [Lindgomyces ingoldianus]KAF2470497.1 hypothetical protein BDR25DRAFT_355593 [Lindgomyces ingoldianus]
MLERAFGWPDEKQPISAIHHAFEILVEVYSKSIFSYRIRVLCTTLDDFLFHITFTVNTHPPSLNYERDNYHRLSFMDQHFLVTKIIIRLFQLCPNYLNGSFGECGCLLEEEVSSNWDFDGSSSYQNFYASFLPGNHSIEYSRLDAQESTADSSHEDRLETGEAGEGGTVVERAYTASTCLKLRIKTNHRSIGTSVHLQTFYTVSAILESPLRHHVPITLLPSADDLFLAASFRCISEVQSTSAFTGATSNQFFCRRRRSWCEAVQGAGIVGTGCFS